MAQLITPVLMAGGSGKRLWPVSRDGLPKQFLPLLGPLSSFQETLIRVTDSEIFDRPVVVTNEAFRFFVRQQAKDLGIDPVIILEPARRDSAAAIAAATAFLMDRDPASVMLCLAADHVILDPEAFRATCAAALPSAISGRIVTFGIQPTEPKTGYGYIRPHDDVDDQGVCSVAAFVEKPDALTAASYVREGYLWNSGNFLFSAKVMEQELTTHAPAVLAAARNSVVGATHDLGFLRLAPEPFLMSPQISIDYAVMEKTDCAAVIAGKFRWSDIGTWDAIWEVAPHDGCGNTISGPAEILNSRNSLVHSQGTLTTLVGVENLIVVATPDAVMVAHRDHVNDVKLLVDRLQRRGLKQAVDHRQVRRPWGWYDSVDNGDRFQVKRIVVTPGGKLSLQKHMHRAEHWIVVKGTAEVTIDDSVSLIRETEAIHIPMGAVHRLANPGKIDLEIVEVQTGSYLGEDDIVRLEDVYSRS
jgi:mannose-1-phosphate guanylyltransferase/mannose-6-phosphate isomerase